MNTAPGRACAAAARAGAAVIRAAHAARAVRVFAVDYKGPTDLVTEVDHDSETAVIEVLQKERPGVSILSEERGVVAGERSGERFIVDPLDGTVNFAHGYPAFGVSVAWESGGEVRAGAVADPTRDELFAAEAGGGAFLNGEPIRVSKIERVGRALFATGFPYAPSGVESAGALFVEMLRRVRGVRRSGSAALDLCAVAAGRLDGMWEQALCEWDTAAGELIVREAGGRVSDYEGAPFVNGGPNIAASNGRIHDRLVGMLAESAGSLRRRPAAGQNPKRTPARKPER